VKREAWNGGSVHDTWMESGGRPRRRTGVDPARSRDRPCLGAAYEYADLGSADINTTRRTGTVQGDYDTNSLNVFNLTVVRRF
jgi:hypothetical protein